MRWEPLNLAASEFAKPSEPPTICGLIYRGKRHLVSGLPEANKTMFSLIVGLEHLRDGGTLALIDFESGPETTALMLRDLGATEAEIAGVYYVEADGPPDSEDVEAINNAGVTLTLIDAAAGAYGVSELDDGKRKDVETFGRVWVDPLHRCGIATLLIDHVVKNAEARGNFAIGSERKAGRVDVHLGLEAVVQLTRGSHGLVKVFTRKDRPGWLPRPKAAELELRSDPETHALSWEFRAVEQEAGDDWRPTVLMDRVLEYVTDNPGASRAQVEKNVRGKSTDWKRKAMDLLVADGSLSETVGPRGARLLDLASPRLTSPGEDAATSPTSPTASRRGEVAGEDEDEVTSPGELVPLELLSEDEAAELERLEAIAEEWERM